MALTDLDEYHARTRLSSLNSTRAQFWSTLQVMRPPTQSRIVSWIVREGAQLGPQPNRSGKGDRQRPYVFPP